VRIEDVLTRFLSEVVEYLPSLAAGLLLMALGWAVAWFVKRVVIQICVTLRLGRILRRFRWARGLTKVDVRLSLYGLLGNLAALVVFLVFLDAAFTAMRLAAVSELVGRAVLVFPRLLIALITFGVGWLISFWAAGAIRRTLHREAVPRADLVASYVRAVILLLFAAMALAEVDVAREIVIIGFTVVYVTLGVLTILLAARGAKEVIQKLLTVSSGEQH